MQVLLVVKTRLTLKIMLHRKSFSSEARKPNFCSLPSLSLVTFLDQDFLPLASKTWHNQCNRDQQHTPKSPTLNLKAAKESQVRGVTLKTGLRHFFLPFIHYYSVHITHSLFLFGCELEFNFGPWQTEQWHLVSKAAYRITQSFTRKYTH